MVGGGLFNMWWFILHALCVYLIDIFIIKMNFCFKINHPVGSFRTTVSVDLQNLMFCLAQNFKEKL